MADTPVPSMKEIESVLLGADTDSITEPGQPKPESAFPDAKPEAAGADAGAAGAEQLEALQGQIKKYEEQLEALDKRVKDNQRNWHQEHNQRLHSEDMAQAIVRARQLEQQIMQAQQGQPFPELQDPDSILEDPGKLNGYGQQIAGWAVNNTLARVAPYLNDYAQLKAQFQTVQGMAARQAHREAREIVTGLGYEDFDEVYPSIQERLSQAGADAAQLLFDPESLARAYMLERSERGLPMSNSPREEAPDGLPASPRAAAGGRSKDLTRLNNFARDIASNLDLTGLQATEADLERVGLVLKG